MTAVWLAAEDALGEAVAERLLTEAIPDVMIGPRFQGDGVSYLKKTLPKFIEMGRTFPGLLLTDLDHNACPPSLIESWLKGRPTPDGLLFRVAVRETESWLMADRDGFADFSGIPKSKLPHDIETVRDPKETLLGLVRRYARKDVKADLLPVDSARTARVGPAYNARLSAFVRDRDGWNPVRASEHADSLRRACGRLGDFCWGFSVGLTASASRGTRGQDSRPNR
jgi:hypothetical protein